MKDITLVSAFIAIGRENYKVSARSNQKYIDYFTRWARMKNDLIFFCDDEELKDIVLEIRKGFGLEKNTQVVVVKDIYDVERKLYERMIEVENDEIFKAFRGGEDTPENIAKYNYVMLMKYYFTYKASEIVKKDTQLAWIDFGYEKGGGIYQDENDYSFLWQYDFGNDVTLFRLAYEEKRPIFEVCRTIHPDSLMGSPVIMPKNLAKQFYEDVRESMQALVDVGLMDDDQLLLLMSSRKHSDHIKVLESYWFRPIHDFGGGHMKLVPPAEDTRTFFHKVRDKLKKIFKTKGKK